MSYLDHFTDYGLDVWHCKRCHKVVRLYDARTETEASLMLQAHTALNCTGDPFAEIVASVAT